MRIPIRVTPAIRLVAAVAVLALLVPAVPAMAYVLTSPRTWVDGPAEGSTVRGDLVVTGSARHRKGVATVEVVVADLDDRVYWNGEGWQREFIRVPVEVERPGARTTGWTYTVPASDMAPGRYRARAFARSVHGNGDAYGGDVNEFRWDDGLDPDLYDTDITAPVDGSQTSGAIRIEGTAHSRIGVRRVDVVVRHVGTGRYWDATANGWTDTFTRSSATLDATDAADVRWGLAIPAEQSAPGTYFARAWVRTTAGNGDPFGRGRTTFTVTDSPPTPAPTSPSAVTTSIPTTSTPVPPPLPAPTETVVWEDTFDSLDTSRWALEHSTYGDGNDELQCYRPENVSVSGGRLVLRAVTETYTCPNGSTRQVTSGMVRSRGVGLEPGQAIEFRVKLNPADATNQGGLWPAVWSSGWGGGGWPLGGELDYLEVMTAKDPRRSVYSVHYAEPDGSHGVTNKAVIGSDDFSAAWHVVRFEYGSNGRLSWYLDGRLANTVDRLPTAQGYPAPFDQRIGEIKINLALGGRPGPLDPRALGDDGATFEVDYIRVLQPTTTPTTTTPTTTTSTTTTPTTTTTTTTTRPTGGACGDRSILLPCDGVLLGASGDFRADDGSSVRKEDHFTAREQELGADFDLFHDFLQWNDLATKTWPSARTQALADDGRSLLINWKSPTGRVDDWSQIAAGRYDDDIKAAAAQVARFGEPMFIAFFHEPEDNIRDAAGGDDAKVQRYIDDYRAAYRHIHDVFEANGAGNAIWVWDMQGNLWQFSSYYQRGLYPGDDVVDWVAWNPYNWHGCVNHGNPRKWKTFDEVISPFYDWLEAGGPNRPSTTKPLMLGEWGSQENGGATNSEQTKAEWLRDVHDVRHRFPRLRALVYFDTEGRRADGTVQFCRWGLDSSRAAIDAMRGLLLDSSLDPRW